MLEKLSRYKAPLLILSTIIVVGLVLLRVVGPWGTPGEPAVVISADEAADHIGVRADVCGEVAELSHRTEIGGEPTFINLEQEHPDQPFTAVIWGDHRPLWEVPPEELYPGEDVCIRGRIRLHEGTPQIVVTSPRQIWSRPAADPVLHQLSAPGNGGS